MRPVPIAAAIALAATIVQFVSADQQAPSPNASRAVGYYDSRRQRVIMVGGDANFAAGDRDGAWSWNGARWELLTNAGPPSRVNAAAAFAAASGRGIIGGGSIRNGDRFQRSGDTWQGDGASWKQIGDHPPRDHQAMVVDGRGAVLMFGGIPPGGAAPWPTDTWRLDGDTWTRVSADGPAGRARTALAYDSRRRQVVLFGGVSASPGPQQPQAFLDDTWIWENGSWRKAAEGGPRGRYAHGMVFDERAGVVLLYSGAAAHKNAPLSDMWQWDGARWTEIALTGPTPGYRYQPVMVFDPVRGRTVLYGGIEGSRNDTWEWDGSRWREITP